MGQCWVTSQPWQGQVSPENPTIENRPHPAVCVFVIQVVGSFTLKTLLKKKIFGDQMKAAFPIVEGKLWPAYVYFSVPFQRTKVL